MIIGNFGNILYYRLNCKKDNPEGNGWKYV
ncbi:hypothetical protein D7V86_03585 [bacterium D16-51]|nr:hypothetical protein D7V96_00335 [bacterium D16-59]RKI61950.1 hypothetical protein D7V86_03585 [bacterium D16-51]